MSLTQIYITGVIRNAQALADVQLYDGLDALLDQITLLDDVQTIAIDGNSQAVRERHKAISADVKRCTPHYNSRKVQS